MTRVMGAWIRWRYGGNVFALKPPLGWYITATTVYKIRYWLAYLLWRAECRLFERYGEQMRRQWMIASGRD